ncbi:hypothetical protein Tco_1368598 [Tanacetum coccineum]
MHSLGMTQSAVTVIIGTSSPNTSASLIMLRKASSPSVIFHAISVSLRLDENCSQEMIVDDNDDDDICKSCLLCKMAPYRYMIGLWATNKALIVIICLREDERWIVMKYLDRNCAYENRTDADDCNAESVRAMIP